MTAHCGNSSGLAAFGARKLLDIGDFEQRQLNQIDILPRIKSSRHTSR
jgi:hypothetical protein